MGLGKLFGGLLGGAVGGTASPGYKGQKYDQMIGSDDRKKYAGSGMSRMEGWASGDVPMMSQADINRGLSGQMGRLDATAETARQRAGERAVSRGEGARSGMLDKRLAEVDRSLLDAKRQTAAPIHAQQAAQKGQMMMSAQGMMNPMLQNAENLGYQDHSRMEKLAGAREAAGSGLHRFLGGFSAGMG